MPFSFLHAADLHLDTPFTNVGGFPDAVGEALREASLEAWANLVEEASRRRVAFVLLALGIAAAVVEARKDRIFF